MRVLWLCNIMIPAIARHLKLDYSVREGWLTGILDQMTADKEKNQITLGICFPALGEFENYHETILVGSLRVECFGFAEDLTHPENYNPAMEKRLQEITDSFKPQLVHIFGTEFPHTLAMTKAFPHPNRILIGLQGIISSCGEKYFAGLPNKAVNRVTLRDYLKKDSIVQQKEKFIKRGENEKKALLNCNNVTGRTDFDHEMAERIHSGVDYYDMKETMRSPFYTDKWEPEYCRKHRIFFSQADYPLKGFHFLLEALPVILLRFPDTEVVVAGNSIVKNRTLKDKLKCSAYGKYLLNYMEEWELQDKIEFLGSLSEEEMKEQYLLCNTFVCASVLENSPNSVAEAMLLGTPVAASKVGGIPSMLTNGEEGLLFEEGNAGELAECIIALWKDENLARKYSENAAKRAHRTHDPKTNYRRLMEIYQMLTKE